MTMTNLQWIKGMDDARFAGLFVRILMGADDTDICDYCSKSYDTCDGRCTDNVVGWLNEERQDIKPDSLSRVIEDCVELGKLRSFNPCVYDGHGVSCDKCAIKKMRNGEGWDSCMNAVFRDIAARLEAIENDCYGHGRVQGVR